MKIERNTKSKKTIVIISGFLLLALVGAFVFKIYSDNKRDEDLRRTSNHQKADETKNAIPHKTQSGNDDLGLPDDSSSTTSEDVPVNTKLIVSMNSYEQSEGAVRTSASTSGPGTCVFQYTNEYDKPVIDEVPVLNRECRSDVPELNFSRLGNWKLKVTYYSDGERAEANQNVTIR